MKRTRVLLLTYGKLPVPAVKGGAIETLLDTLIEENEQQKLLELIVVSKDDETIPAFNQTHRHTQVVAVKTKDRPFRWFIQRCWNKVRQIVTGKRKNIIPYPELMIAAKHYLQKNSVDCLIDLNFPERIPLIRRFFSGKLAVYLHNDYLNYRTMKGATILHELDGILSVCDFLNEKVQEISYSKEWPALYRVNNGIALEEYQPAAPAERQKTRSLFHYKETDCVIVFSGRVTETKGVHLLFDALSQIESVQNVKVLVLGGTTYSSVQKDSYFKKVMAQAEQLPIEVTFTGYIEKSQIPFYLKAADICAVPSIFHETCCLSAVEAQAMGIPVIATKIGGIPEYISEKSALLIEYDQQFVPRFAEGLEQLIHDDAFRDRLSKEALKGRNRHSKQRFYDEFVESIKRINESGKGDRT